MEVYGAHEHSRPKEPIARFVTLAPKPELARVWKPYQRCVIRGHWFLSEEFCHAPRGPPNLMSIVHFLSPLRVSAPPWFIPFFCSLRLFSIQSFGDCAFGVIPYFLSMPIYEFHCNECQSDSEVLVRSSDWKGTPCPHCGSRKLSKKLSVFSSSIAAEAGCPAGGPSCEMKSPSGCGCCCGGGPHSH
jgi:putative FmdB family regulatory protein